jgi:glycosyltransferase involved in cell wall biosynthesis
MRLKCPKKRQRGIRIMCPKISIIVPVYNVEAFLPDCINSILNQKVKELEVILINDGSVDGSGTICNEFASVDKRVKVIHTKNQGASAARNSGIQLAKGEYIGFVDSDDTICEYMYEKMYQRAIQEDSDIVACGYMEIDNSTGLRQQWITPLNNQLLIEGQNIRKTFEESLIKNKILGYASLCNKLYKRSFIVNNQLKIKEDIKIAEDLCFNIEVLARAKRICAINEPLYKYRRINSESIMNKKEGAFRQHLKARREILFTLKRNGIDKYVYESCVRFENSKTIAEYIERLKLILKDVIFRKRKIREINELLNDPTFINALFNYDGKSFVLKAKLLIFFIKGIFVFKKNEKYFV